MHPRLLRLAGGVLVFHVLNSVLQEGILYLPGFKHGVLLSFLQTVAVTIFSYLQFRSTTEARRTPLSIYVGLSIVASLSVVLTNKGTMLLNYPTQVVFKSSKLLFVMIMRAIFMKSKRKPGLMEVVGAVVVVVGLSGFTWASHKEKLKASATGGDTDFLLGVVAIFIALVCDALLYMGEEVFCFSTYNSPNVEVILFTTMFAVVNTFGTLCVTGGVGESIRYIMQEPRLIVFVAAFSACNFLGTHYLLSIVSEFDANYAVLTTSVRKMCTILLSFLLYPKPFTLLHFFSLATVVGGIYLHDKAKRAHHPNHGHHKEPLSVLPGEEKA
eukprot:PhF_6_TR28105/c0_g1_i1/m.41550/K15277/SLC35B3, PAPST2; solute carrier family 35 (adenosine 3'-phospho 5'-phosphosulfate transporter), member B3